MVNSMNALLAAITFSSSVEAILVTELETMIFIIAVLLIEIDQPHGLFHRNVPHIQIDMGMVGNHLQNFV